MPRKILFLTILIISVFNLQLSILNSSIFAQSPTPNTADQSTCDLCGWCPPDLLVNPTKPPNWGACINCLYNTDGTPRPRSYYTVIGCLSTDPTAVPFTRSILTLVFSVVGGIAFLAVLFGIGVILTSSGNPERIQTGKDILTSSLFGLLLIIFSVFLLRVVGFDILRIPGFG